MMFATPIIFGWASPYFGHLLPGFEARTLIYAVVGDVLLLISLFVLGGAFWDKLRSLFQHNAYAIFPDKVATYWTENSGHKVSAARRQPPAAIGV